jgi:hypothetical protein
MVDYGAAHAAFTLRRAAASVRLPSRQQRVLTHRSQRLHRPRNATLCNAGTDQLLLDIADYVVGYELQSAEALQTARYSLLDSLSALRSAPFAAAVHATRCSTC